MKTKNERKATQKFDLEKFDVAKLKNLHVIVGGAIGKDDPIDTNHQKNNKDGSSADCNR
ncbi:hypothetical protein [Flavobacterium humidisoli]|uniref:Natural product n=1 Tax=Flavobacterium humidisoli TaxID=2937442 RepID=A0ABY4LX62_9FLAO|nr:hypothetical protein [Flavobacterium humidisoli]UPZ17008.1 hypothetical protein M0M44_06590 [Flavobacterium humidisoli]